MTLSALSLRVLQKSHFRVLTLLAGLLCSMIAMACSGQSDSVTTLETTPLPAATVNAVHSATDAPVPSPATVLRTTPTATMVLSTTNAVGAIHTPTPHLLGPAAPDFDIKLFQGEETLGAKEIRLVDVLGEPLVLNFWARFCGPCWKEMPELQKFYEEFGDRIKLLGIDIGQFPGLGSPKDASKLLTSLGVNYPAGYTDDESVVSKYRVRAMPTTIFITAQGEVFRSWTGSITREEVTAIARDMLEEE